jgi:hypothetical protein
MLYQLVYIVYSISKYTTIQLLVPCRALATTLTQALIILFLACGNSFLFNSLFFHSVQPLLFSVYSSYNSQSNHFKWKVSMLLLCEDIPPSVPNSLLAKVIIL